MNTIVAALLTEFELPRTQQEFDDSYAFKVFCFKFVNYYATMFYIAFFKDTFSGHPADLTYIEMGDKKIRWKGCPEGGCNYELAIQLRCQYLKILNLFLVPVLKQVNKNSQK